MDTSLTSHTIGGLGSFRERETHSDEIHQLIPIASQLGASCRIVNALKNWQQKTLNNAKKLL